MGILLMNSAKLENGKVVNIAVGLADGYIQCGDDIGIGWSYADGKFAAPKPSPKTNEQLKNEAREWRNSELLKADIEINKIEDSGGESMGYRKYRTALREWPQSDGFPDKGRPTL